MVPACLVPILILFRFIEKARQDSQSLYALPAWDKDLDTDVQ